VPLIVTIIKYPLISTSIRPLRLAIICTLQEQVTYWESSWFEPLAFFNALKQLRLRPWLFWDCQAYNYKGMLVVLGNCENKKQERLACPWKTSLLMSKSIVYNRLFQVIKYPLTLMKCYKNYKESNGRVWALDLVILASTNCVKYC
jgi:hypothetical protein